MREELFCFVSFEEVYLRFIERNGKNFLVVSSF